IEQPYYMWRESWSKAPFLLFCIAAYILLLLIGGGIIYLILPRLRELDTVLSDLLNFQVYVSVLISVPIALFLFVLGGGLTLIIITALTGIDLLYPHNKPSITIKILFPLARTIAKTLGYDPNTLLISFVKVNNALTIAQRKRIKGQRIMILLPHCLQIDKCHRKITNDINNCVRCGNCPVGDILNLTEKLGITTEIVNGGTLALRKVASFRPDGVVAVACERDLTSGVKSIYPIPVYGIINDRPYGPCFNTSVDMNLLKEGLEFFQNKKCYFRTSD
ncbi:MAG: DUF116 domain-containing protein, partial [Chitinivibrionales bacterium]